MITKSDNLRIQIYELIVNAALGIERSAKNKQEMVKRIP